MYPEYYGKAVLDEPFFILFDYAIIFISQNFFYINYDY